MTDETVKLLKFSRIEPTLKDHEETDLEEDTAGTARESNCKILNMKKNDRTQDQEKHQQNAVRTEQSVSKYPDSSIDLEQDINLDREFDAARKRRHLEQQCSESRGRHKEDVQQEEVQKEDEQEESVWQEQD